jgi:hypothetical protein
MTARTQALWVPGWSSTHYTGGVWVIPDFRQYRFASAAPQRHGDWAIIEIPVSDSMHTERRNVELHVAVNGERWLIERPAPPAVDLAAVKRVTDYARHPLHHGPAFFR